MKIISRLQQYIEYKNISLNAFDKSIDASNGYIGRQIKNQASVGGDVIEKISCVYADLNIEWLITGKGEMLTISESIKEDPERKKIPFYEDVATIGGINDQIGDVQTSHTPTEFINAGDWFEDATSAIRHYGDSMIEYSSGSILVLRRVKDFRLLIWGRNYSIETTEYRITKQLQDGGNEFIIGYSTNEEKYADGKLIHSPIYIPKDTIRSIDLVIGCVKKEYSSGLVPVL
jgi:hypothetical protein